MICRLNIFVEVVFGGGVCFLRQDVISKVPFFRLYKHRVLTNNSFCQFCCLSYYLTNSTHFFRQFKFCKYLKRLCFIGRHVFVLWGLQTKLELYLRKYATITSTTMLDYSPFPTGWFLGKSYFNVLFLNPHCCWYVKFACAFKL